MDQKTYFISYTTRTPEDVKWAKWVEWVLRIELGHKTIMQEYDSPPGGNFKIFMDQALKEADCVICVLSRNYLQSVNCAEEWTNAKELRFVKTDDSEVEGLLKSRNYIDLYEFDENEAKQKLITYLELPKRPEENPGYPGSVATSGKNQSKPDFPGKSPIRNPNFPDRNPHFTGREDILEKIHRQFQTGQAVSLRQTIAGLGGVGKTQTAIEYAYRHASDYDVIWWVNAETGIYDAYLAFARRMNLLPTRENVAWSDILQVVKEWFDQNGRFLFIFDNVEDFDALRECLPRNTGQANGHVLITTRNENSEVGTLVDISVFTPEEAVAFLKERLERDEGEDAKNLAERLGYLPLALEQAAAYMRVTKSSCQAYLGLLKKHGLKVFDHRAAKAQGYAETVATTWWISFEKIALESATQLFYLCAWFAPDDIPLAMLIKGREHLPEPLRTDLTNELKLADTIYELTQYSLLKETGDLLSIHQLVQEVARYKLKEDTQWLASCFNVAQVAFSNDYGTKTSMDTFTQNVPHVLKIVDHVEKKRGDGEDVNEKKISGLYINIGVGYYYSAQYNEALKWYEKALAIYEKMWGKDDRFIAMAYNNIALVYDRQGDYPKALGWHEKALAVREEVMGNVLLEVAMSYGNIANVYDRQGDYPKALEWHEKALTIGEMVLGKGHPGTAKTYSNIAKVYDRQGDYSKALESCEEALAIQEKVLGKEHLDTAMTYNNIAGVYNNQGDYPKALEWHEKALAIRKKVLGKYHPDTAMTYNNLARVYFNQGDYPNALEWYEKALSIQEKMLNIPVPV